MRRDDAGKAGVRVGIEEYGRRLRPGVRTLEGSFGQNKVHRNLPDNVHGAAQGLFDPRSSAALGRESRGRDSDDFQHRHGFDCRFRLLSVTFYGRRCLLAWWCLVLCPYVQRLCGQLGDSRNDGRSTSALQAQGLCPLPAHYLLLLESRLGYPDQVDSSHALLGYFLLYGRVEHGEPWRAFRFLLLEWVLFAKQHRSLATTTLIFCFPFFLQCCLRPTWLLRLSVE